jgi:leader peptidase (prepilin peptidase) / N-methyltransferase
VIGNYFHTAEFHSFAQIAFGCALTGIIVALAAVDLQKLILPDRLNLLLAVVGAAQALLLGLPTPVDAALGAATGALGIILVGELFRMWRGIEGLGFGDVKFVAASGIWIGWQALPLMLSIASTSALAFFAARAIASRRFDRLAALPFGPFLGLGTVLTWTAMESPLWTPVVAFE